MCYCSLLYLSVSTRGVIGQFSGMYLTVRLAKFESFLSRAPEKNSDLKLVSKRYVFSVICKV